MVKPGPDIPCPGGEPADCGCGHKWELHHHCCIVNPAYPGEAHEEGIHRFVDAEECEAEQHEGMKLKGKHSCFCNGWHLKREKGKHAYCMH